MSPNGRYLMQLVARSAKQLTLSVRRAFSLFLVLNLSMQGWPQPGGDTGASQSAPIQAPSGSNPPATGTSQSNPPNPPSPSTGATPELVKPVDSPEFKGSQYKNRLIEMLEKSNEARREAVNTRLPRFGESFFQRSQEELTRSDEGLMPPDYTLRPGDELNMVTYNIRGGERASSLAIDQKGQAYIPNYGPATLSGLTLAEAQSQLSSRVTAQLPNFRVKLTMSKIRKVRVFIFGEARKPGGFLVNPGSTIVDAVLASGGPTETGSYRKIELQRRGSVISRFDLYELLLNGRSPGIRLVEGDRVFVPSSGPQISVSGEVVRPAKYEILRETNLAEVVKLAGGLKPDADQAQIHLERLMDNRERKIRDVRASEMRNINIRNGDTVTVLPLLTELSNGVFLEGAVQRPGWYSLPKSGLTVSQLMAKAEGVKPGAYSGRAEIYRRDKPEDPVQLVSFDLSRALSKTPGQDLSLRNQDHVVVYDVSANFVNRAQVRIEGEVATPGDYARFRDMRVRDLVFQAGGLKAEASDEVEIASRGTNGSLIRHTINISEVVANENSENNLLLSDLDTVIVRKGLRARLWPATIQIGGEVNKPGVYPIDAEKDTLADVIRMAGGLTNKAFPRGAVFVRKKSNLLDPAQERLTRDIFDLLQDIANKFAQAEQNRYSKSTSGGGVYSSAYSTTLIPLLARGAAEGGAREVDRILTSTRLPIALEGLMKGTSRDPGAKDGDLLFIPAEPQVVVVAGAVTMPSPILYEPGQGLDYYIARAGGLTDDAAEEKVFVISVDGSTTRKDQIREIGKGDVIIAPPQPIVADPDALETFVSLAQVALNALFLGRILRP